MRLQTGTQDASDELQAVVRALVQQHGLRKTSALLGLTAETILRITSGLGVRRGSLALLRESVVRLGAAGATKADRT